MRCPTPIYIKKSRLNVPCGKCAACRTRIANEWVTRLTEEEKYSRSVYFVTLTYTNENIPHTKTGNQTLSKNDLQDFLNLLRQYCPYRYFAIGEYGDKGERPHYHLIIFNFFPIVNPKTGNIIYHKDWNKVDQNSLISNVDIEAIIYKAWKKGIVQIQPLEGGAIRYVSYYTVDPTVKRITDDQQKSFANMSTRPPIGYQYYKNSEICKYHQKEPLDNLHYNAIFGITALPRIYRTKIFSKITRTRLNKQLEEQEDKKIKSKNYAKNYYANQEFQNDKLNKRIKNRTI